MPRAAGSVALAALLAAAAVTTKAHASDGAPAADLSLDVVGACPDVESIRRLLGEVVSGDEARGASISIWDQGPHYRIVVRKTVTTLDDPARDCTARARQAVAIVADDLRSHPQVFGPPVFTIEKGVVFDVAPGKAGTPWAPGAEFRGALGSGRWSLVGSAGARGPATLVFENGFKAELLRFPLDAGARVTWYLGRFRPWLVVGGSATPSAFLGQDLIETDRVWRLELGVLGMAGATLRLFGRIGVAAAINIRWQPRPYQLQVIPHGTVGESPSLWLGLSLNYTLDGKPSTP